MSFHRTNVSKQSWLFHLLPPPVLAHQLCEPEAKIRPEPEFSDKLLHSTRHFLGNMTLSTKKHCVKLRDIDSALVFKAVFNIRAQKNFISLTAKKKKDSRRITSLPTNFYFYCSQTGWCELGRGYLYSISSDELLDGGEQSSPSSRSVLFYFWMPPLGSGWAACQSGVRLLRRLTHSQPHCFSSHM